MFLSRLIWRLRLLWWSKVRQELSQRAHETWMPLEESPCDAAFLAWQEHLARQLCACFGISQQELGYISAERHENSTSLLQNNANEDKR
jgi:hypothetical protein